MKIFIQKSTFLSKSRQNAFSNVQAFFFTNENLPKRNVKIQKVKSEVIFWRVSIARSEKI
jgi:hypothetical protein